MQQYIRAIGHTDWSNADIKAELDTFAKVYAKKPVSHNDGGMKSPHAFALWFMLRRLQPDCVVESGVWKGQSTWLIEQAVPDARIFCIDINFKNLQYRSKRAVYFDKDFSTIQWQEEIANRENTVLFFDDHQSAFDRIPQAIYYGFKHLIFEDNYPANTGDCYSLKKVLMQAGHTPIVLKDWKSQVKRIFGLEKQSAAVIPNKQDMDYLVSVLDTYYEFPPVYQKAYTRWGAPWSNDAIPTPSPILTGAAASPTEYLFDSESGDYTWICYTKIKA